MWSAGRRESPAVFKLPDGSILHPNGDLHLPTGEISKPPMEAVPHPPTEVPAPRELVGAHVGDGAHDLPHIAGSHEPPNAVAGTGHEIHNSVGGNDNVSGKVHHAQPSTSDGTAHSGGHDVAPPAGHGHGPGIHDSNGGGADHGHAGTGSEGAERTSAPTGPMPPDKEAGVANALAHTKLNATDQERVLAGLRKSPYGARAADLISNGHLSGIRNYDEVLKMFKDKRMPPAATMALEHAADLQEHGIPSNHLGFEIKDKDTGLDLDVTTFKGDGTPGYGYQLKDVQNIAGINSAIRKAADQLTAPGADVKVAILDIH